MSAPEPPAPAASPCGSCPYRKDVPAGVWAVEEYQKLPAYDLPTGDQPFGLFFCHQATGRLCAGWVGCHDMQNSLAVRIGASMGQLDEAALHAIGEYRTGIPLFESGAAAAAHGMSGVQNPDDKARHTIARLVKKGVVK